MSNAKKVLSILLAVVMVACLSVNAFAAVSYETDTTMTQTWTLSDATEVNSTTYTVDVSLTTNYPTGSIQFVVENTDNTNAVLTGATLGAAYPADYAGEISFSNTTGKVMIIVGSTEDTLPGEAIDGVIATLTYTYSGTGSATLTIADAPKAEATPDGTLIAARLSNGNAITGTEIVGQPATVTGSASIGAASLPADLAIQSAYASSGIIIDTNKTFGGAYDGIVYGFADVPATKANAAYYTTRLEATNGGSLTVVKTPYMARPASYGTGTTIQVKNADGTLSKTYVIAIFGDVNGDSIVSSLDITPIVKHVGGVTAITDQLLIFVSNVLKLARGSDALKTEYLHNVDSNDLSAVVKDAAGSTLFNRTDVATAHNTYNTYYQ